MPPLKAGDLQCLVQHWLVMHNPIVEGLRNESGGTLTVSDGSYQPSLPSGLKSILSVKQRSICRSHPPVVGVHSRCTWALLTQIRGLITTYPKTLLPFG